MVKKLASLLSVCLLGLVLPAKATTIGPACGSCLGSSYTLDYTTTADPNIFDIFLQVNATGYSNGATDRLNSVSLKLVPQSSDIVDVHLIGSPIPTGFSGGAGGTLAGGLSAAGCDGSGGGFFCSETTAANHGLEVAHAGDIYTFEWQLQVTSPADLMLAANAASVKALYVTSEGQQHGITSEDISLTTGVPTQQGVIPEPSSLLLLGTGIIGIAETMRRKIMA